MNEQPEFDPNAPLPDAPTPWASSSMPAWRPGPPYLMSEMIAAEPALAERLLERMSRPGQGGPRLARTIRAAAETGGGIVVTGCGTSENAARGLEEIVADSLRQARVSGPGGRRPSRRPSSRQAFELALDPPSRGLVVGVSHEGETRATVKALEAARAAGARTALITVSDRSPGAAIANLVVTTGEADQSWCHTVGYLSPLLVGAAVGAAIRDVPVEREAIVALLRAGEETGPSAEAIARRLAGVDRVAVVASGADRPAAAELALKIEEGAQLPATARDVETILHGHLAATDGTTGLVLLLADPAARAERTARATDVLRAAAAIGIVSAAILATGAAAQIDETLTPAGRLVVPEDAGLPGPVAALFGTAVPLQLLAEWLARARGTNPDTIRREQSSYARAAAVSERPG